MVVVMRLNARANLTNFFYFFVQLLTMSSSSSDCQARAAVARTMSVGPLARDPLTSDCMERRGAVLLSFDDDEICRERGFD